MDITDQKKLLNAGFTIIRPAEELRSGAHGPTYTYSIKAKAGQRHEWFTLETGFPSKAARDRRVKEFKAMPTHIQD